MYVKIRFQISHISGRRRAAYQSWFVGPIKASHRDRVPQMSADEVDWGTTEHGVPW